MIIHAFDDRTDAIIEPKRQENAPAVDALIVTFSHRIEEVIRTRFACTQLAILHTATGEIPVYELLHKGKRIAFFKTYVGAPATVGLIEDALCALRIDTVILFGGAGCLDKNIARGRIMVPTAAWRDEGTSYHYAPAADWITLPNAPAVATFMERVGLPYVCGKTWTTDAIYRETRGNFEKRRRDGCIAVEMEVAAVQALCDFRHVSFYCFLKSGDLLDAPMWDPRS